MSRADILMVVPQRDVRGGIAAVTEGYYDSRLTRENDVRFVESYCDGSKWKKLGKALSCYRSFRREIRRKRPDIVHIHSSFGPSFYRKMPLILMASVRGIPVVNHIHGSELDRFYTGAGPVKQKLVRWVYGLCARTVVLSEEWKERLSGIAPADRIRVVRNYAVTPVTEPTPRSRESRTVLFMGLIIEMKGCFDIPVIASRVLEKVPDARFIIAGEGEADRVREIFAGTGEGKKLSADPDRESPLHFPGWVRGEKKTALLREASVFLLPSYTEAMPMSILETMGYAVPTVASRVGGIPALVDDGRTGILCPAGDCTAFADALTGLLLDEDRREKMGRRALEKAQKEFGIDRHIDSLESIYRELLGSAGGKTV